MGVSAVNSTLKKSIIDDNVFLKLPRFQRKYQWVKKGVNNDDDLTSLFDDIIDSMNRAQVESKFIGSILIHDGMQGVVYPKISKGDVLDQSTNIWKKGLVKDFQNLCSKFGVSGWNSKTSRDDLIKLLIKHRLENRAEIIDGQQRLTSLALIIAACKFVSLDNNELGLRNMPRRQRLVKKCEKLLKSKDDLRIILYPDDQTHLEHVIEDGFDYDPTPPRGQVYRIPLGLKKIRARLNEQMTKHRTKINKLEWLEEFVNWTLDNLELVWVVVPNKVQAHLVFQSLNSRGLPLALGDLVNSHLQLQADLISGSTSALMEQTTNVLSSIEDILSNDEDAIQQDFYYRYWLSNEGWADLSKGEVLDGYKKKIEGISTPLKMKGFLEDLKKEAKYYTNSKIGNIVGVPNSLQDLNAIQKQHIILYMAGQRKSFNNDDWKVLTEAMELFVVRYRMAGNGRQPDREWSEWAALIDKEGRQALDGVPSGGEDNIVNSIKAMISSQAADNDVRFIEFMNEAKLNKAEAKLLIRKIENVSFGSLYNTNNWQSEHIAPINHDNWPDLHWKMTKKKRDEIKNRLGNFLILTATDNRSASNLSWGAKRYVYQRADLPCGTHVREFIKENRSPWTPDKIKIRTSTLASKMPAIWPY